MKPGYLLLLVSLWLLRASHAFAQQPVALPLPRAQLIRPETLPAGGLTLSELEQMALANNPTLPQAGARVDAAQGTWVQEGLYPNPRVGYQGTEIGNEGHAGLQGVFISQEIVRGGKLQLSQAAAEQHIREAEQNWSAQELRVLSDVRMAFYQALAAQQTETLAEKLVQIGAQGVQSAQKLFDAQEVARTDLLQASIEADQAALALDDAHNRRRAAWRRLAAVTGRDLPQTTLLGDLQNDLAQLDWNQALSRLLAESPEVTAAYARVDAARWNLRRQSVASIPNIDLMAGLQLDTATDDVVTNLEASLAIPMHDCNQGAIRRAEAELAAAQYDVDRIRLDLQQRLAVAFERYENARQQAQRYRDGILPNSSAALELVRGGYENGEFNFLALLTAQRTFFQANLSYLKAPQEWRENAVLVEGLLLSDSLSQEQR